MIISRRKFALFLGLVAGGTSLANSTDCDCAAKIEHLQKQLMHLPAEAAAPARVSQLVLELSKLQPRYANRYFRWGISKLPYDNYNANEDELSQKVIKIVKSSDLPPKNTAKISNQIQQAVESSAVQPVSPVA